MRYFISFGLLIWMSMACSAQPYGDSKFKQKFNKADALMYDGAYMEALPLFEEMYADDSTNANLNYHLGVCYLMGKKDYALAIRRLESATKGVSLEYSEANWKEKRAPGITYYYLGRAYHVTNNFERAVANYYSYRSFIELDDVETYNQVRQQIQWAENAMELVKNPVGVKITNLGPTINTKYPDYCPVVSADGRVLIFTSRREGGTGGAVDENGNYFDDIYICTKQPNGKWSNPKSIGSNINTPGHEAAIGLSPDGQLLFIYKDDNGDGNLYFSTRKGEDWTKPEPLGSDINTSSWETHATVNATQDLLIFVSNRGQGGYGGRDLWYCKKLPNGEWGLAMNMGSVINSQYEEDSPFISADGSTLIFSSQGHTSMGGFDIFKSEFVDGAWTVPENLGYPINTAENDVFFVLNPDGRTAYYSSEKEGGFGSTDLYFLKLEAEKSDKMAVARGNMKVPAMAYADISAQIVVTDEGGAQVGTYRPNPTTGFYVLVLKPGETYTITYEADGYTPVVSKLPVALGDSYEEYDGVVELDEVVFGENIQDLQADTKKLQEEMALAEAKIAEEKRLAEEAETKAKADAERLAMEAAKNEERLKAEKLAAEEKEAAAKALAAEQEKANEAEKARKQAEAKAKFEAEQAAALKKAQEDSLQLANELAVKSAEEAKLKAEREAAEAAAKEAEEAAKEKAELEAKQRAEEEARLAAAKQSEEDETTQENTTEEVVATEEKAEEPVAEQPQVDEEVASEEPAKTTESAEDAEAAALAAKLSEEEAARQAEAEAKRQELQKRIAELKAKQKEQEQEIEKVVITDNEVKEEVKEVEVKEMAQETQPATLDHNAIEERRQAMIARIEELKKRKSEVDKQKVVDEKAVAAASAKEEGARKKKQELVVKSDQTKEEIERLQKELTEVEKQMASADSEAEQAKAEAAEAQQKVEADIAEAKRLADEAKQKEAEAEEARRKIEELKEQERKRLEEERIAKEKAEQERLAKERAEKEKAAREKAEQERLAKEKAEQEQREQAEKAKEEQREQAEKAKEELIRIQANEERQRQVQAAMEIEERKRKEIEAAEKDAFSKEQVLANATTLEQLRELNKQLIKDNLDLKKQLAEINAKLDLILQRLDDAPEINRVNVPDNSTMESLQQGNRLILRNIFFDYNESTLRSKSKYELNKLYEFMKNNPEVSIDVSGHTDSRGNDDYNMRLSKDRAQAVVDYLVRNGISSSRLKAIGYGETRPIARNENADLTDNPIGRQLNRRIEISLSKGAAQGLEVEEIEVPKDARIK